MGSIKLLDDAAVRGIVMNPAYWETFPYFKTCASKITAISSTPTSGCNACARRRLMGKLKQQLDTVRTYINNLDGKKKLKFKELGHFDKVRLIIKGPTGSYSQVIW